MVDVYFQSEIGMCSDFSVDGVKKDTVSIVISPLRAVSGSAADGDQNTISVVSGCNMWHSCLNEACFFSIAARRKPKLEKRCEAEAEVILEKG